MLRLAMAAVAASTASAAVWSDSDEAKVSDQQLDGV